MVSVETLEMRLERVFVARYRDELDTLLSDLLAPGLVSRVRAAIARRRPSTTAAELVWLPDEDIDEIVVGRSSGCDAVLGDASVSRRHLKLRRTPGGGWCAVDLGSTNGTWMLGRRVGRVAVAPGDEMVLGHAVVRFS
jgi:hypothetical protein